MSSNQHRVIKEDVPQMRSVRIGSAIPAMAPPMSFGRGAVSTAQSKTVPNNNSSGSSGAVWKVGKLQSIPSFYKLERTHVVIDDAPASEVAMRIAESLRLESVSSTFHNDEAMVEAETHDAVTFTTRLFSDDGKVVVEMQRLAGCCYLFHNTCRAVLRAAKQMDAPKRRTYSVPPSVPRSNSEEEKESLESGLDLASSLLKKDRFDAHLLAMESLSHISKSAKCECLVAKSILSGPLLETLVSLIECWKVSSVDDNVEEEKGEIEEQHCATMHRLAISVLANCLSTLESQGELKSVLAERREQLCSPSLLMALVGELRHASLRPHDACEAARCLQYLVRNCSECKPRLVDCDCAKAATIAFETGACSHANLEEQCRLLQREIANCI